MSIIHDLIGKVLARKPLRDRAAFHLASLQPEQTQRDWLLETLRREEATTFGQDHHFASLRTVDDFRRQFPITTYDDYEPYIERVKQGDCEAMFHRQRVRMFGLTSGTSSFAKYVPITDRYIDEYRRGWTMWGLQTFEAHPDLPFRAKMQFAGNPAQRHSEAGIPCGSISGLTAQMIHPIIRRSYVMPIASFGINDIDAKYYLGWRLGLLRDVGMWFATNPAFMVNLARFGDEQKDVLIRDIHDGTLTEQYAYDGKLRRSVRRQLKANPQRAAELEKIVASTGHLYPKDAWPTMGLIGCWLSGTVAMYTRHFPEYFGETALRDIGLIATEGRVTLPKADHDPSGIVDITAGFFEFIPIEEIDADNPQTLLAHELEEGREYSLLMTTSSGFYRYNIFDIVRCTGFHERTPMLEFLHKGQHISDLSGEKVTERQVVQAVDDSAQKLGLTLEGYLLAPVWNDGRPFYALYLEETDADLSQRARLAEMVHAHIREHNHLYNAKHQLKVLLPVRAESVQAGTWKLWDRQRLAKSGGSAEQYKRPCLIVNPDWQHPLFDLHSADPATLSCTHTTSM